MNEFNGVEIVEENTLDFSKLLNLISKSDDAVCTRDDENVDLDSKQRTVEFWRSGMNKRNRELSAVQHGFRKVTSVR